MRRSIIAVTAAIALHAAPVAAAETSLDYGFYKASVEPIFLKKRPGHARCVTCHEHGSPPLPMLPEGATNWSEEQSRQNFAIWKQFVTPGNPLKSSLLIHPLAESGGGEKAEAAKPALKLVSSSRAATRATPKRKRA